MRIAIVDDERPARSELRHQIQELLKEAEIVEGDSGAAALQLAGDGKYELFFLDINLGDISGTVLVNAIHNMQPQADDSFHRFALKILSQCLRTDWFSHLTKHQALPSA